MNKLTFLTTLLAAMFLTSCQFSENIYLNEDGSGKMEFSFDASELMQMAGEQFSESSGEKDIDSTFTFKEIFDQKRDSISQLPEEEQVKLKALEPFSVHMVMSEKEKKMNFDLFTDFKNASELQDMFTALNTVSNLQGKDVAKTSDPSNPFSSMMAGGNSELNYSFENGVFKRSVEVLDKEVQKQIMDSLGQGAMMFANSKYKLNYHFPRKVKSVSNDKAMFSADGKTVILEYGLMDYMADPEIMNLEIVLED
ncbi:hypothetical protein [uncultured Algibacter sp.]|uniref:hypothetical protein n=1 Tax=uncultured Algibacter sp. TaxID=298659 RepID=UPI002601780D|nr:hypothetical protein [uncultured Algibacter sp.]